MASRSKKKAKPTTKKARLYFSISTVARLLGVSSSTLRMWENLGLVSPNRTASGYRQFTPQQVERLKEVQRIKNSKGITSRAMVHVIKEMPPTPVITKDAQTSSIATQLKRLRERQGLTLPQAAQKVGISVSFLSGIERGRVSASVATLQKLSQIYGSNVLSLFGEKETAQKLIRSSERRTLLMNPGVVIESLAASQSTMEPHLFRIAPGASSGGVYTHEGEEFLYVLHGAFEIWLDDEEHYCLAAGDSLYFSSRQSHRWAERRIADERAHVFVGTRRARRPGNHDDDVDAGGLFVHRAVVARRNGARAAESESGQLHTGARIRCGFRKYHFRY